MNRKSVLLVILFGLLMIAAPVIASVLDDQIEDYASSVVVSSQFSTDYRKEYAYDDNTTNEWATAGNGVNSWIAFFYSTTVHIESVQLLDRFDADEWGVPRFTFSDGTYQDGTVAVSDTGYTTYTLGYKPTMAITISIVSGGYANNRGLAEIVINRYIPPTPTVTATPIGTQTPMATQTSVPDTQTAADIAAADPWKSAGDILRDMMSSVNTFTTFIKEYRKQTDDDVQTWMLYATDFSPFDYLRSFYIVFQDFVWMLNLIAWFMASFLLIMAIFMLRFLFSLWGIFKRILDLIPG
jgi:hypothetical protein